MSGAPSLPDAPTLPQLQSAVTSVTSNLQLPDVKLPSLGLPDFQLPTVQLPTVQLPNPPDLKFPEVHLPTHLPHPSNLSASLQSGAASAAEAAGQLPNTLAAQLAILQELLLSDPGAATSNLGLEPHFGTHAAQQLLQQLATALGAAAAGASPGSAALSLAPILALPTGATAAAAAPDGRLAALPDALTAAWHSAGDQIASLLPPGAVAGAAAAAAAASAQPSAGWAGAGAATEQLRAAALTLPEASIGGIDFPTVCLVAAGAAAAIAASVPASDYEASAASGGGGASDLDPPLSHEYDADAVAAYFARRPVAVAARAAQLAGEAGALGFALLGDMVTGRLAENEGRRARQLRGAIERLGPAYVKVAQVGALGGLGMEGWCFGIPSPPPRAMSTLVGLLPPAYFTLDLPPHLPACCPPRPAPPLPQALSTRVDLLSPEYFTQIQLLQDRVPPFPCQEAKKVRGAGGGGARWAGGMLCLCWQSVGEGGLQP